MNRNDLFKSFNGIDEELLRRSENVYTLGCKYLYIRIAVAVLAIIVCVFGISFLHDYENG
jgi:purine-cytosine permease-like protein